MRILFRVIEAMLQYSLGVVYMDNTGRHHPWPLLHERRLGLLTSNNINNYLLRACFPHSRSMSDLMWTLILQVDDDAATAKHKRRQEQDGKGANREVEQALSSTIGTIDLLLLFS